MKIKTILSSPQFHIMAVLAWVAIPAYSAVNVPYAPDAAAPQDFNIFAKLAKQSVPSVVNLSATTIRKTNLPQGLEENPFAQFFGPQMGLQMGPQMMRPEKETALGSGFIIDPNGMIMTNNHVVANADQVEIQLTEGSDDKVIEGKVVGRDPELDVALIQFKPPRALTALTLGNSDALEVGEFVMAIGNPYGQGHSVSHGIVSAKGRLVPDSSFATFLQTDAPINPGNSGGPLLNLKGEVVGINNAIDPRAQGISFAIPINFVKNILPQLQKDGKVMRGFIGATVQPLTPELAEKMGEAKDLSAPLISDITLGGPAARAGIRPYDIVTKARGKEVHTSSELIQAVTSTAIGEKLSIDVLRSGRKLSFEVKIETRPSLPKLSQR